MYADEEDYCRQGLERARGSGILCSPAAKGRNVIHNVVVTVPTGKLVYEYGASGCGGSEGGYG